jgi:hypothetical protein
MEHFFDVLNEEPLLLFFEYLLNPNGFLLKSDSLFLKKEFLWSNEGRSNRLAQTATARTNKINNRIKSLSKSQPKLFFSFFLEEN